jgi:hypothetical protein
MSANMEAIWVDRAAKAVLLIRILVGWVFLSEGIQKFLFPSALGVGRFAKIGIPWLQFTAPFVGVMKSDFDSRGRMSPWAGFELTTLWFLAN